MITYFGYGSLVNRTTHRTDTIDFMPVRLHGWRRQWLVRPKSKFGHVALLSVKPDAASAIDGLLVVDRAHNLDAVDAREIRYDRKVLELQNVKSLSAEKHDLLLHHQTTPAYIYQAKQLPPFEHGEKCRILRSYLDAVMQGYLKKFGREGLLRFIRTTDNFEIGIREDRDDPVYTRPVTTTKKERILFDDLAPATNDVNNR